MSARFCELKFKFTRRDFSQMQTSISKFFSASSKISNACSSSSSNPDKKQNTAATVLSTSPTKAPQAIDFHGFTADPIRAKSFRSKVCQAFNTPIVSSDSREPVPDKLKLTPLERQVLQDTIHDTCIHIFTIYSLFYPR